MADDLYSVEQVAKRLGLSVRTVRKYVRDGRLKAVRIGKQYRIASADLDELTGGQAAAPAREAARRRRHVEVSSIVQVDAASPDTADRVATTLTAAAAARREGDQPLHVQTFYDEERASMRVVVVGGLATSAEVLRLIGAMVEADS